MGVAQPRRANCQRGRQKHGLVSLARQVGKAGGDADVGRREYTGIVEVHQEPRRTRAEEWNWSMLVCELAYVA
jgi:hypothetical protein